jgi:putative ATP-binding cassette transporter
MTDSIRGTTGANADAEELDNARLVPQLKVMFDALWASRVRNRLLLFATAIVLVVAATAYGQNRLNAWNKPFYDAIARHDFAQFLRQLGVFGLIAGALLVLNVAQRWLGEMSKVDLRAGLVQDLVHRWMQPGCAAWLAHSGPMGLNPDQRMHEDARHLSELSADLSIGLLQATILLGTFIEVLWALSSRLEFRIAGHEVVISGYMVWAAVVYSVSASLLSIWVGRSLVNRNADHYAREADLRYSLVRVNENFDAIALAAGEAQEERHIKADLEAVLVTMRRLVFGLANLTWVTAGSGWITLVAPIIAAAPLYFSGSITFGGLMLAAGAFMQVQSSSRWFVDNFSTIADWRATLLRVASFRRSLLSSASPPDSQNRIEMRTGPDGTIRIDDLVIAGPAGKITLAERHVELPTGERVLILGGSGMAKNLMFRTLARLWPLGTGSVTLPAAALFMYMPRTAYLPPGTLREVLAYPASAGDIATERLTDLLVRLGLDRLIPVLDTVRRWDQVLSGDDQQCLVFARVAVRRPACLLIDEVLDFLEEETLARVWALLAAELPLTTVIHLGRSANPSARFTRTLHLRTGHAQPQRESPQSGNAVRAST